MDSPQTYLSTNSGEDSDTLANGRPRPRGRAKNRKKFTKKKSTPSIDGRVAKASQKGVVRFKYFSVLVRRKLERSGFLADPKFVADPELLFRCKPR
jgi:hypothetical protein